MSGEAVRVVVFRLGEELYACDVLRVEEVVEGAPIHPLPDVPPPFAGVLRLRGALVPVLDVAPALGLRLASAEPAVLIVESETGRLGIAVDEAREVAALPVSELRDAPGAEQDEEVTGVARVGGELVTLLDLGAVLGEKLIQKTREPS